MVIGYLLIRALSGIGKQPRQSDAPDIYSSTGAGPEKTDDDFCLVWRRSSQKTTFDA
jgi:hypothetical protein